LTAKAALLWAVALGCLFVPAFPDPPLHSGAYVQSVTARSAVVGRIEPASRSLALEVRDPSGALVAAPPLSPPRRRHWFAVDGLQPGTRYAFRLLDAAGQQIDAGAFTTAPDGDAADRQPLRFLVVGDSGAVPWWVWLQNNPLGYFAARYDLLPVADRVRALGERMAAEAPAFWLHVGDVVYPWSHYDHWTPAFFRPFAELLRQAPVYLALGNHDVLDDGGRQALRNLWLPRNEVTGDERYYTFAWGPVRLAALDLNQPLTPSHPALPFLERALAGTDEPWRVVFAHYPILSASRQGDRADLIQWLLPALQRLGVDLLLTGHDHNYQRFDSPDCVGERPVLVVTGGGGKSLYELRVHPDVTVAHRTYHYCRVDVAGRELRVSAVGIDGGVEDAFTLDQRRRAARPGFDPVANPRHRRIQALLR
jgi:hypothetical protein